MKKFLLFLLAIPMLAMVSCGDDDVPNVDILVQYKGASVINGTAYVVKGSVAYIDSLWVEAVDKNHVASIIPPVRYVFPYGMPGEIKPGSNRVQIPTDSVGTFTIGATFGVAEKDCSLAICAASWDYKVVADSADIPANVVRDGIVSQKSHE